MSFLWPDMLWLLAAVPPLVGAYLWVLRKREQSRLRYASLAPVRDVLGAGHTLRRRLPPLLLLTGLAGLIAAAARPQAVVTLPSQHETAILAMDVSGSMRATDVEPSRLAAAQEAARAFIARQPPNVRIGVVAFAATASLVQAPTHDRDEVLAALERIQLQRGTSIASGLLASLKAIFPEENFEVWEARTGHAKPAPRKPAAPGSYGPAFIVLLSDGQRTAGPDPMQAARIAAERGVRVYTVGVGTAAGTTVGYEGWNMRVRLDEETLRSIADATRGEYFQAASAAELKRVYGTLDTRLVMETKKTEVTALFAAAAGLLLAVSALLSLAWFGRLV